MQVFTFDFDFSKPIVITYTLINITWKMALSGSRLKLRKWE